MKQLLVTISRRREFALPVLILLTVAGVSAVNPGFLAIRNGLDILDNCVPVMVVACGVMLVIVTGEIDISVGALMGLLAAILAVLVSSEYAALPWPLGIAAVLAGGTLVGLGTGTLVTLGRVPSIIVTLGLLTALRGVTILVMGGNSIKGFPTALRVIGTGRIGGVPVGICIAGAVVAFTGVLITRTPLGRRIFAVGSSPAAAIPAGLSPRRVKLFVFAYTGFLTGVATILNVAKLGNVEPTMGKGLELLAVTCVVVGGVSISGGRGRLRGVVPAVLLMVMIRTALTYLNLGPEASKWERAVQGAFILLAVVSDHLTAPKDAGKGGEA